MRLAIPSVRVRWLRRAVWLLLCGLVFFPSAGCTAFQTACSSKWMDDAFSSDTDASIDHVAARWDHHLRTAPDPRDFTAGTIGIIGRVYLESEQTNKMCEAHGTIVIGMLDMTPTASGKPPVLIANYKFDAETLRKLKVKDPFSDVAYTVFLPWTEYRPEIKQVKLLVKYITRQGEQHMADASVVTLQPTDQPAATMQETVGPTLKRQFDMQVAQPQRLQGAPPGMPYTPVQMDKIMPPAGPPMAPPQANGYRPNAPQQQADAPYQPIIMNPQPRNSATMVPQAIAPDIQPSLPAEKTTIQYLPPPPPR
jgi:hypothetical protein